MRTIRHWLSHLLWRAEVRPRPIGIGVKILLHVGDGPVDPVGCDEIGADLGFEAIDAIIREVDPKSAERVLTHLARLGTVDRVVLSHDPTASPDVQRVLARLARRQRRWGLDVIYVNS